MIVSSYFLGIIFIVIVVIIWSLASALVQHVYRDLEFDSPFVLTYICTSLFVVLLPTRFMIECTSLYWTAKHVNKDNTKSLITPWRSGPVPGTLDELSIEENDLEPLEKHMTLSEKNEPEESEMIDLSSSNHELYHTNETDQRNTINGIVQSNTEGFILGHYETLHISMIIAPIWFFANYFYNLSLQYTSITSSTIIASTGSLFTFLMALYTKDEKYTLSKSLGVGLCIIGSIITGLTDKADNNETEGDVTNIHSIWGDILGLLSAMGYGLYTVLIRIKCPKDERHISMQLLFGYIGLLNMTALSPVILYQYLSYRQKEIDYPNSISVPWIGWTVFGWLVLKGLFDNVLSDYLWARSIVLTSATVATVGLGLTIPFAFLSDWLISAIQPTIGSLTGAISVLVGFVLVNL